MIPVLVMAAFFAAANPALETARDQQDRPALERLAAESAAAADKAPNDSEAQFRAAVAASYLAEVALEVKDKKLAEEAAERGIKPAERAVALKPDVASYYVVLGTLYGQVVPANLLFGLSYGKKSKDAIQKAVEKDPKLAVAYEARGVGNYYLPAALGGGFELAVADFRKSIELDPKRAESYLWLGLSLRKENKNAEARQAFQKSLEINPHRVWVKEQLDKTPAQ
ncbi:MAG: tetratricopeptide repeat protein [Bryobacteraceae bacterium]|jgi:tetratricopeptide (TPR) repeat protein